MHIHAKYLSVTRASFLLIITPLPLIFSLWAVDLKRICVELHNFENINMLKEVNLVA